MEIVVARRRVNLEVFWEHRHDRLVEKKMAQAYELLVPPSDWVEQCKKVDAEIGEINEQDCGSICTGVIGPST